MSRATLKRLPTKHIGELCEVCEVDMRFGPRPPRGRIVHEGENDCTDDPLPIMCLGGHHSWSTHGLQNYVCRVLDVRRTRFPLPSRVVLRGASRMICRSQESQRMCTR